MASAVVLRTNQRSLTPDGQPFVWNGGPDPDSGAVMQSRLGAFGRGVSSGRSLTEGSRGVDALRYGKADMRPGGTSKCRSGLPLEARNCALDACSWVRWIGR